MPRLKMAGYTVISKLDSGSRRIACLARDDDQKELMLIQPDIQKIKMLFVSKCEEKDLKKREALANEFVKNEKEKFKNDFEKVRGLYHPHVAQVLKVVFDAEGENYVAICEYPAGENIFAATRGLTWLQKTALIAQVLSGLQFIHNNGYLHLNIKSRYVRVELTQLKTKLTDFGYAYEPNGMYDGKLRGSAYSVAPEVVLGQNNRVDARADIYSVGVLWYYILTGKFPFPNRDKARTSLESLSELVKGEDKPMAVFYSDPTIPNECNEIVMKMLERDPNKRFASAEEARAEILERWPETNEENLDKTLSTMRVLSAEPSIEEPDDEL